MGQIKSPEISPQVAMSAAVETPFGKETLASVAELQTAFKEALVFHREGIRKSRDVQDAFGLNFKLSWQIYRVVTCEEPLELCGDLPTSSAMRKFIDTIAERGASSGAIERARKAVDGFETVVDRHAGDRTSFDTMTARMVGGEMDAQTELVHRRSLFEAYRYLLGIEVDAVISTEIIHPSRTKNGFYDVAYLRSRRGFRRLTSAANLVVDKRTIYNTKPDDGPLNHHAIDESAMLRYGMPLLPLYSTRDLPLRKVASNDQLAITEWGGSAVGKQSTINVAFGEVRRAARSITPAEGKFTYGSAAHCSTPVRTFIEDIIVHRPTFGPLKTKLTRRGPITIQSRQVEALSEQNVPEIPCKEEVLYMGQGIDAVRTAEMLEYEDMLRFTCATLGWNLEEMDVYRLRVEFPMIHTILGIEFEAV